MENKSILRTKKKNKNEMVKKESWFYRGKNFDYQLLFIVLFLVCFGLVMIYSSSSYQSSVNNGGDSTTILKRQMVWILLSVPAMFLVSLFNYQKYRNFTKMIYWSAVILQIIVVAQEASSHGAKRWIAIGGFQFQPSEVSKIVIILYLAHAISGSINRIGDKKILIRICGYIVPLFGLIAMENLSTGIIILSITYVMLLVASKKIKIFIVGLAIAIVMATGVLFSASYRLERIQIWLDPEGHDKGFQTMQALYAIGSGGLFGKGIGKSMQKMGFIPEAHNDMIFSVICEELGIFGASCIIIMFMMLLYRIAEIARKAPDLYSGLVCTGIMTQVGVQIFINIGVVTNTIPPTGIPLPFISYGGTSVLILLIEMGMVLGISRHIKVRR